MPYDLQKRLSERNSQSRPLGTNINRFASILTTGKPPADDDMASKLEYEVLKHKLTRDPLNDQLKQAQIGAYKAMANSDVPTGFVRVGNKIQADPTYKVPTPLSEKDEIELERQKRADDFSSQNIKDQAKEILNSVQEVKKGKGYFGPLGNMPSIPFLTGNYDKRRNWEVNMDRITSGEILDQINDMKSASKTGATGFGALAVPELNVLKGASTTLKRDLGGSDAERYLNDIEKAQKKILGMPIEESVPSFFQNQNTSKIPTFMSEQEAEAANLPVGTEIIIAGRKARIG